MSSRSSSISYPSPEEKLAALNRSNREAARLIKQGLVAKDNRPDYSIKKDPETLELERLRISSPEYAKQKSSNNEMSKPVTFSGKPRQLQPCLTYCRVKLIADGTIDEAQKAGFLASLLRGPALSWLASQIEKDESILSDYDELVAQLKAKYKVDETAEKLLAAKQLAGLYQKGSVQDYATRFCDLAEAAGIPPETKAAFFTKGLKQKVREALITGDNADTFDEIVAEASRIDANFYYSSGSRHTSGRTKGPKRGKDGKFKSDNFKREEY